MSDDLKLETGAEGLSPEARGDWRIRFKNSKRAGLMRRVIPPRRWLLDSFLPAGVVGMVASTGGSGKTALLAHLAVCVASGQPFLGKTIKAPGSVLMLMGEEDDDELDRRLKAAGETLRIAADADPDPFARIYAVALDGLAPRFASAEAVDAALALVAEIKALDVGAWSLVIVDPLTRFADPEAETDNARATDTVKWAESLKLLPGSPTVLLAHHTRKSGSGKPTAHDARGSSALKDGARWLAVIRTAKGVDADSDAIPREPDKGWSRELVVAKSNYSGHGDRVPFLLEKGVVRPVERRGIA
jgi:RecA-family ATPase